MYEVHAAAIKKKDSLQTEQFAHGQLTVVSGVAQSV